MKFKIGDRVVLDKDHIEDYNYSIHRPKNVTGTVSKYCNDYLLVEWDKDGGFYWFEDHDIKLAKPKKKLYKITGLTPESLALISLCMEYCTLNTGWNDEVSGKIKNILSKLGVS